MSAETLAAQGTIPYPFPRGSWLTRFGRGLASPLKGFVYLYRHPTLWLHGLWPMLWNLLITLVVLGLFLTGAGAVLVYLHPQFGTGWLGILLEVATGVGLVFGALVAAFVVWQILQAILCSYFYGRLTREVELQLGLPSEEIKELNWSAQTLDACRAALALLGVNLGLLLLHIVPVIGSLSA